ncbi:dCTP deaminase [Nocardia aurantia]|uniref:dCTP deaminase n=1 Tax=Nocardia aurantia TaxID=2585199 RepID=A0A7K0DSP3_9NOCA|nr:dCTP deaminase [Nocardia aurantia]MQY28793.1 dCTP deaminase [Nocardia aurantia]
MILTGDEIMREHNSARIDIRPFNPDQVNPNSYDFRLGSVLKTYVDHVLDARLPNSVTTTRIPEDGLVLTPGRIYLGHTLEIMGSDHYVPIIRGKSSTARLGLFVHVTADIIDIGSHNQWTLQLYPVQPVRIYPGMLVGQVTFWKTLGEVTLYSGKYQGSMGPVESLVHLDFHAESIREDEKIDSV